jgi:hypothetical protein
VKERPAELAIGDALQTDRFLLLHHITYGVVLNRAKLFFRDLVSLKTCARFLQMLGSKKTADVISAKRRVQPWHGTSRGAASYIFFDRIRCYVFHS